jgi:putative membrane protein
MVTYNPKDWFTLIFRFHRSDTFRILLPTMLLLGILTGGFVYLNNRYFNLQVQHITLFHQISGFVISLVLVFRINTAYDRWWEGRRQWGSLINCSRNIAIKLNAIIPASEKNMRADFHALISSFAFSLKEHLRNNSTIEDITFCPQLKKEDYELRSHKPAYIAKQIYNLALDACEKYPRNVADFEIISRNLNEFMDICGACERIKKTPIPYSYSLFIKKIIFIYMITMPFTFGQIIHYWAIPVVMIMFYAFASLELLSEEIEDPFGFDPNDLPTDEMSVRIKEGVREILVSDGSD